jgi:hypothetical protein
MTALPSDRGRPGGIPLPGQPEPGQPLWRDDAHHVCVVAEAGDLALLDGQQAQLPRLADGVAHGGLGNTNDRRQVPNGQPAILPADHFSSYEGKHALLG